MKLYLQPPPHSERARAESHAQFYLHIDPGRAGHVVRKRAKRKHDWRHFI